MTSVAASITENQFDVAIAGGGVVGLVLAAGLRHTGLKIAIIEALPKEQALTKPQAYAISLLSGKILAGLGVWENIKDSIGHFDRIQISDNDYQGTVPFTKEDVNELALGHVAEHPVILQALENCVEQCPRITWFRPAELIGFTEGEKHKQVTLQQEDKEITLQTKLLVAADGARSRIRSLAGIKTKGWKYWQSCVAFTIQHQAPDNTTAFERFCDTGPMGILPLPGDRAQVVWTMPHHKAHSLINLPEADFIGELRQRIGDRLGEFRLVNARRLFPVQLMQSDCYVQPRLALIGDAAHCCHPVGGQGLNLGIRDGAALAQVIATAHNQGEDWGSLAVLKRYEHWRKPENWLILGFTDLLDRFFSSHWPPAIALRRLGLEVLRLVPPAKKLALRLMTGLLGRRPQLATGQR
ncbi:FAD-dependent hydroxylase [Synechocystis salina]|uniref:FAD-dependent hydroxylase n=1 Tax=Synechocystis salina LEGE 00031 TaxID=1828736 RepID=A0ABR9VR53_9SYNC|nr:FAD-dependent hydroxylase [Synechocystis salina]MBE9240542.1 FAD-dependent hydroxylase [Synechocystis salina LEGE 00041]MBE9253814.1 FAD-dependent hydroxylase [Synechocystis salina LEGE 00031]